MKTENPQITEIPFNNNAEMSVLGGLLIDNNAIDRIGNITEQDFYSSQHRMIFAAIKRDASLGKQFDVLTIAEELQRKDELDKVGGLIYLASIAQSTPSSANIKRYCEIVIEASTRRKILSTAADLLEVTKSTISVDEIMDRVQKQLLAITETTSEDEPKQIGAIVSEHLNTIEKRLDTDRKGITTGLIELDKILNGGFHRGQLIVLAARPGMGKTALSMHFAISATQDEYGCLYLSMEMVEAELADRAISSTGKVRLGNILTGNLTDQDWSGLTFGTSKLYDLPLHVLDKSGLNFYQVANYARRHKRKHGLDLLIVDYLQLMTGAEKERHSQIEAITRNLKVLAKELNIALVILSQLSRKTEEVKKPKLSHLRDSGSIEQDADVVLFIHREEVDNPETQWKNYADIHIAKQRQGALGRVGVTYFGNQVRFENYAGELPDFEEKKTKRGFNGD